MDPSCNKMLHQWVEAISLKLARGATVANFIKTTSFVELAFLNFYFLIRVIFINMHMRRLLNGYGIDHVKSSSYYPQGNDQAEAANKILLRTAR